MLLRTSLSFRPALAEIMIQMGMCQRQALDYKWSFFRICQQQLSKKTVGTKFSIHHRADLSTCCLELAATLRANLFNPRCSFRYPFDDCKFGPVNLTTNSDDSWTHMHDKQNTQHKTCRSALSLYDKCSNLVLSHYCTVKWKHRPGRSNAMCKNLQTCSVECLQPSCKCSKHSKPIKTISNCTVRDSFVAGCKQCQQNQAGLRSWNTQKLFGGRRLSLTSKTFIRSYSSDNKGEDDKIDKAAFRLKPPWRIMFFGTDEIAEKTLRELYQNMSTEETLVESLEVVTVREQREVRRFAESVGLQIHGWPIKIEHGKFDVGILASFGHLIPDAVIQMFPYGILNMHPSLLPRWRGASPVIHTILHGDKITGVSVMDIRPKHFDIGPVLLQRSLPIPHRCTSFQLADIVGRFGAHMVIECLHNLPELERFERKQEQQGVTYAHKIKHVNANIDWENQTAFQVDCQYRAIAELIPLKTEFEGHVVKLLDVLDPDSFTDLTAGDIQGYKGDITLASPGTVVFHRKKKCLVVKCKKGFIGFYSLVLKRKLSAQDFYNGYLNRRTRSKFTSLENELGKYIKTERIPARVKA